MPTIDYRRLDLPLRARTRASGDVVVQIGTTAAVVLRKVAVRAWHRGEQPRTFGPEGAFTARVRDALAATAGTQAAIRVVVEVGLELAALPWEAAIEARVVRSIRVPPRIGAWPLSVPLRFLHAGPRSRFDLEDFLLGHLLAAHDRGYVDHAVLARTVDRLAHLEPAVRDWQWPTVDVLHLAELPDVPAGVDVLSTAHADVAGTLGWLCRLTNRLRCRLVVVAPESCDGLHRTRALLTALAARGGPGSVAVEDSSGANALGHFYAEMIHDVPVDLAAFPGFGTVVVGAGREDLVRPSQVATALAEPPPVPLIPPAGPIRLAISSFDVPEPEIGRVAMAHLAEFRDRLDHQIHFADHEREGILPVGSYVNSLREEAGLSVPNRIRIDPDETRYVNPELGRAGEEAGIVPVDQRGGALVVGEPAVLTLSIGPAAELVRVVWTRALLDDVMFLPEDDGVWVEFGITGIDFRVEGDTTQEVWLPRNGVTDAVQFSVVPRRRDVSVLRYCLYVRQTLVQSFKLAATTIPSVSAPVRARPKTLARRLGLPQSEVGHATWLPRLEFSLTPDPFDAHDRRERSVSIIANQHGSGTIVTVKGRDVHGTVEVPGGVGDFVRNARQALEDAATPPVAGADPRDWLYGYGDQSNDNQGTDQLLQRDLASLAEIGWGLYSQLISWKDRQKLNSALAERPGQIIEIAHTLLPKVIPWALVYDRRYSSNTTTDPEGRPYDFGVCPAALPRPEAVLPDVACGEAPNCLLAPTRTGGHYCEDTVVCANRFWGFRHQVELPPQQAHGGQPPAPAPPVVKSSGPNVQVGVGMHGGLSFAKQHDTEVRAVLASSPRAAAVAFHEYDSNLLRDALETTPDLDVVYFYCHAEGTQADASLRFRLPPPDVVEGRLTPGDLDGPPWQHHPIVILNGCRTAAFSVDALSPFLITLVRDREASALVATEIAVWEPLARVFAIDFMAAFLAGSTAGEAMLHARRKLLAVRNPLGLSYTLYGLSDLEIAQ